MTVRDPHPGPRRLSSDRPLQMAILAMGGQGGGVLSDWIVALAEGEGWVVQASYVAGVAQRTGATIYYVEMLPAHEGRTPVLSLMPTPGDVDVVLAAEYMEAGRSMLRGLVTPDRTTLIASSHRAYAVVEKERPGDGTGDPAVVAGASGVAARRTLTFDMQEIAERHGTVISAALFGALAGSGVLPFPRAAFERTVRAGGRGADASLAAFAEAFDRAAAGAVEVAPREPAKRAEPLPASAGHPDLDRLVARVRAGFPAALHPILHAGLARVVDWQDPAYGEEYLDLLIDLHAAETAACGASHGHAFTAAAAKYVALAMTYDDVIRVADLKIRASRFARVRAEVGVGPDDVLLTTEYMHPRMEEVVGTLPRRAGLWIEARPRLFAALDRVVNRGRRVRTDTLFWFLGLYAVAGLRSRRRGSLRHARERDHTDAWLAVARRLLAGHHDLAVEVLKARRLVKGYSDTHARGRSKFDRVMAAVPLLEGREDGAAWMDRLVRAALMDEEGTALNGALATIRNL